MQPFLFVSPAVIVLCVIVACKEIGLEVNVGKTKNIVMSRDQKQD